MPNNEKTIYPKEQKLQTQNKGKIQMTLLKFACNYNELKTEVIPLPFQVYK